MSLFEHDDYQWRETYFVLFEESRRPMTDALVQAVDKEGEGFHVSDVRSDANGRVDSLTIRSPDDYAAMDISYVSGEEVTEQVAELSKEFAGALGSDEEKSALSRLARCTARLDVYHFEQTVRSDLTNDEDSELMDPGALLTILERLAHLCDGVVVDPQSGILL